MTGTNLIYSTATVVLSAALAALPAAGQLPPAAADPSTQVVSPATGEQKNVLAPATQPSLDFDVSGTKFSINSLMHLLKDREHEGWVLAAYPDPKTSRPLIGAGFSLDVEAREHLQNDPLNPQQFLEPSSAQLWQAAGLDAERLQAILEQFDRDLAKWSKKNYRKKIKTHQLKPQLTEEEASRLLRVSALQAAHNAKAYCRSYDQLTASQQMALSQLVFQLGVNLEEFLQFLAVLNDDPLLQNVVLSESDTSSRDDKWQAVQQTLIDSQWARRYRTRAITVIAMFDPTYEQDPKGAERRIQAVLRPPPKHTHKKPHGPSAHTANSGTGGARSSATSALR
jgi:GH24 family phage-related lysozyme (muramidase)